MKGHHHPLHEETHFWGKSLILCEPELILYSFDAKVPSATFCTILGKSLKSPSINVISWYISISQGHRREKKLKSYIVQGFQWQNAIYNENQCLIPISSSFQTDIACELMDSIFNATLFIITLCLSRTHCFCLFACFYGWMGWIEWIMSTGLCIRETTKKAVHTVRARTCVLPDGERSKAHRIIR